MKSRKCFLLALFVVVSCVATAHAADDEPDAKIKVEISEVTQSVIRMGLRNGVTADQSVDAMMAKAREMGLELVGLHSLHESASQKGQSVPRIEILQLCNTADAIALVTRNPVYAAYLPCRISLTEDVDGRYWVTTVNLDVVVNNASLSPDLQEIAIRLNQGLLAVMTAGVTGY